MKNKKNKKASIDFKKMVVFSAIAVLIIGGLVAYGVVVEKHDKVALGNSPALASQLKLPEYFDTAPPQIREVYEFALLKPDVLQYMACYCGCGSIGHKSNKSCFINQVKADGAIVLDKHGTMCDICLDVALTTKNLMAQGKPLREIRSILDKRYAGKPTTDTPYPPE